MLRQTTRRHPILPWIQFPPLAVLILFLSLQTPAGAQAVRLPSQPVLVATGLTTPAGIATDPRGNVYVTDFSGGGAIKMWNASTMQTTTLISSGLNHPEGVAVDALQNVFAE